MKGEREGQVKGGEGQGRVRGEGRVNVAGSGSIKTGVMVCGGEGQRGRGLTGRWWQGRVYR